MKLLPHKAFFYDFDRSLPAQIYGIACQKAKIERAENSGPEEATSLRKCYWKTGRILRIRFIDGETHMHEKVVTYAPIWTNYANLHFHFDDSDSDAEIRISFDPQAGNWSYIGTDALTIPPDKATMNLGDLAHQHPEGRYRQVVLHEFGHAIGLVHEHQSPNSPIQWNIDAVQKDMRALGWNDVEIEVNILSKYNRDHTQYWQFLPDSTTFDADSIMMYSIPPHWTDSIVSHFDNQSLSSTDMAFVSSIYPKEGESLR